MSALSFACRCGALQGTLQLERPSQGNHVRCFCQSCRAAAIRCGEGDPGAEGVALFQTTPDRISFQQGQDNLAVFSFGPRNILRWHADCCGAALFTTLRSPKFALASLITARLADPQSIGPVRSRAFVPTANGKSRHDGKTALIGGVLLRALTARLSGRWRKTPFFDPQTLEPAAPVTLVSSTERKSLLNGN